MNGRSARALTRGFAVVGAALVLVSILVGGTFEPGTLGFALWGLLPWALLLLAGRFVRDRWAVAGAGLALLVGELGVRAAVFVFPRGSTAALLLLFSPVYLIGLALLPGALVGWLVGRGWRRSPWLGGSVSLVFVGLLALLGVSLARPDLAPWSVAERRAVAERVGEPRLVKAEEGLERVLVAETSGWYQTGELDGEPGDEIAIIHHRSGVLLDPARFETLRSVEIGEPEAPRGGSFWNGFSRLALLDGRLVVVQSGGGYSETEVLELDGRLVWRYRPDPQLPPSALRPADLDGDEELELYSAAGGRIVRLDDEGEEIWSRDVGYGTSLVLVSAAADRPAWVVGTRGVRDGWTFVAWDTDGEPLGEVPAASDVSELGPTSVVDLDEGRLLLTGRSLVRGIDLEGRTRFELPLGDFTFQQATAVRFEPAGPTFLVVVAATRSDVGRWRVLVLSPDRSVIYEEILGESVALMAAHRADGADTLLFALGGKGLWTLRPARG